MRSPAIRHRSLYTALVAQWLFPLQERLKGHDTAAVRRQLEASQWWEPEKLRAWQLACLQQLLLRANATVPYYRRMFAEIGFEPAGMQSLDDLARLPFLTKPILRAQGDALRAADATGLTRCSTGGSSGEPLRFFISKERVAHDVAAKWRATRWWGVDIGDPEIVVWGSPIELGAQDRLRALRDRLLRSRLLPAFAMSEAKLDAFLQEIRAARPKMLFGYPSALSHLARHAEKRAMRMDDLGIRVAFVTGERLYDEQRAQVAHAFGCAVANGYGGRDAGFIAHQCPAGGMHLTAEDVIVEIVDPTGQVLPPGQAGEVVVTHLASGDFPFIRYRTGDIAALDDQPCPCGRGLPLVKDIQGRTTDFVVAEDGTVLHGLALIYVLRDLPGIAAFKVVQESRAVTRVLVVPGDGFQPGCIDAIRQGCKARLGQGVEVRIERVAEIPPEPSGKFRYVASQVAGG